MAMSILKVAIKEFNNRGLKVKAIKSLMEQSTIPKASAFTISLKLIPLIIPTTPVAVITANQIADLVGEFKKINLALMQQQQLKSFQR